MKNFLKQHVEGVLIWLALLLLVVLGAFFYWGVRLSLTSVRSSLKVPNAAENSVGFDIKAAKSLNLKLEQ